MRRFAHLLWLDLCALWASRLPVVLITSVIVQGLALRYAVPERLELEPTIRIVDQTERRLFARALSKDPDLGVADRKALEAWVGADRQRVGLIMRGTERAPRVDLLHSGAPTSGAVALAHTTATMFWGRFTNIGWDRGHRVSHLGQDRDPIPFNQLMLVLLLSLNVAVGAITLLASLVHQEKASGAIHALRVSPVRAVSYLSSKLIAGVVTLLPLLFVLVALVAPEAVESLGVWVVLSLGALIFGCAGVVFGALTRSVADSLGALGVACAVLMIPFVTYFIPALDRAALHWIPSWGSLYGLRAGLFPTGREDDLAVALQSMLPLGWVLALAALVCVQRILLRRSR